MKDTLFDPVSADEILKMRYIGGKHLLDLTNYEEVFEAIKTFDDEKNNLRCILKIKDFIAHKQYLKKRAIFVWSLVSVWGSC